MDLYILNLDGVTRKYIQTILEAKPANLGKIHVYSEKKVDLGPDVTVHPEEGFQFLAQHINERVTLSTSEVVNGDHLIPSHIAPHVLAQVFIKLLEEKGCGIEMKDFPKKVGTPYERDLERGLKALSFATWVCPIDCIEPEICPHINDERAWHMGKGLEKYSREHHIPFITFESVPLVGAIGTIPMQKIINGWLKVEKMIAKKTPSELMIATHSKCHGILAHLKIRPAA